jgi:hypothetical protein
VDKGASLDLRRCRVNALGAAPLEQIGTTHATTRYAGMRKLRAPQAAQISPNTRSKFSPSTFSATRAL